MKKLKTTLLIFASLGIIIYLYFPWNLAERGYWMPAWWEKSLFNFCKYSAPDGYKVISYSEGAPSHPDDKYLIILQDQKTGQLISISRLRGFYYVPTDQIKVDGKSFSDAFRFEREHILDNFNVITYLPVWHFLRQDNLEKIPNNLLLRGITVEKKEEYSTDRASIYYLKGSFQRIGFFKKMPFSWGFATPVFDFMNPSKGALAILNNKDSKETIIVVSSVPSYKDFDEGSLKRFLSSVNFDKEIYKPALLQGIQSNNVKTKIKYGF